MKLTSNQFMELEDVFNALNDERTPKEVHGDKYVVEARNRLSDLLDALDERAK
jgi:hypothetical protein